MTGVPQGIVDLGWWAIFLFLFVVVFVRAQGTYWLGRGVAAGANQSRWRDRFEGAGMRRAKDFLEKYGPVGVPVSFLTVGFQTMVNGAAGFARMRYGVYTLVMIPGCLVWAAMYTALGYAVWHLISLSVTWALAAVLGAGIVIAIAVVVIRRRRSAGSSARTPR